MTRLGELLCDGGLIRPEQLEEAVQQQVLYGGRLGTNLVELNYISVNELAQVLSRLHHAPLPSYEWLESPERAAIRKVSRPLVEKRRFIPLRLEARLLHIAVLDPHDPPTLDELRFATGCRLKAYVLPELLMQDWLQWLFQVPRTIRYVDTTRTPQRASNDAPNRPSGPGPAVAGAIEPNARPPEEALGNIHQTLASAAFQAGRSDAPEADVDLGRWRQPQQQSERPTVPRPPGDYAGGLQMSDSDIPTKVVRQPEEPDNDAERESIDQDAETAPHAFMPLRPSPSDIALHEQAMLDAEGRDALIEHALMAVTGIADYGALLAVTQGMVEGLKGCEATKTPCATDGVLIPLDSDSVFARAAKSAEAARYTVDRPVDLRMLKRMGREPGTEFGLFPIVIRERVVNLLYADNGSAPLARASFAALEALATTIAQAYGHLILRRKGHHADGSS